MNQIVISTYSPTDNSSCLLSELSRASRPYRTLRVGRRIRLTVQPGWQFIAFLIEECARAGIGHDRIRRTLVSR